MSGAWLRVGAAGVVLLLLKLAAPLLLPLVCSLLLVLLLSTAMEALQRRGVPGGVAATLVVFGPAALIGVSVYLCAPRAAVSLSDSASALLGFARSMASQPGPVGVGARWVATALQGGGDAMAARVGRLAVPLALQTAVVLMLAFFLLLGQRSLLAGLLGTLPGRRRRVALLGTLKEARAGVERWFVTSALVNFGLGVATMLAMAVLGLPGPMGWGVVTTVLLFVPYLGPMCITLLLAAAGSATEVGVVAPAVTFLALHAVEANFLSPWLMGSRLRVSRPMLLVAVQVAAFAWGIGGAILAVPVLIVIHAGVRRLRRGSVPHALLAPEDGAAAGLADLAADTLRPAAEPGDNVQTGPWEHRMPRLHKKTP